MQAVQARCKNTMQRLLVNASTYANTALGICIGLACSEQAFMPMQVDHSVIPSFEMEDLPAAAAAQQTSLLKDMTNYYVHTSR